MNNISGVVPRHLAHAHMIIAEITFKSNERITQTQRHSQSLQKYFLKFSAPIMHFLVEQMLKYRSRKTKHITCGRIHREKRENPLRIKTFVGETIESKRVD